MERVSDLPGGTGNASTRIRARHLAAIRSPCQGRTICAMTNSGSLRDCPQDRSLPQCRAGVVRLCRVNANAVRPDMPDEPDDEFYARADAHIHLSNDQAKKIDRGKVSASMLYASARFNAWISACGFEEGPQMASKRQEMIDYFAADYRRMLEENLDDYIANFDQYMKAKH
jgi:hypothetical protein